MVIRYIFVYHHTASWRGVVLLKILRFLLVLPILLGVSACHAAPSVLSERDYLALVRERNSDLAALRQEVEARGFSVRADVADQRPSLGITAEESRWTQHDRGDRTLDLTLSQRLDLSGRYGLQEKDLLLGLEILRRRYADAENETLCRADVAYLRGVIAGRRRAMAEQILRQRRDSLRVTQEMFRRELVPKLDLLRAQSQVDDGEALLLQAAQVYDQQILEMSALAGQAPVVPQEGDPAGASRTPSVDPDRAWLDRPDVAALLLGEERASVQRSLAAKGLAPLLDLTVGLRLGEDYRSSFVEDNQGEVLARAVLTVPLADGNRTLNATEAATRNLEKARLDLRAKKDSLLKEVGLVRERWTAAVALEETRRRQASRAGEELEISEMMYREGLAAQIDLLNAQETDQRTRSEHFAALLETWLVLAEADRVMGRYVGGKD